MADAPRIARLELAAAQRVARVLVPVSLTRVDYGNRELLRQLDPAIFERAAVEEQCGAFSREEGGGLVENPTRNADRTALRPLTGEHQLERLNHEVRDRAQRDRWGELECRRRAKPGPARK